MTGSSTKQAGAPRWSALQRWTLGVTSMAAFMAGMAGEQSPGSSPTAAMTMTPTCSARQA
jgi:hypothetical protein